MIHDKRSSMSLDPFMGSQQFSAKLSTDKQHRQSGSGSRISTVSLHPADTVTLFSELDSEEKSDNPWDLIVNVDDKDLRTREEYLLSQKQMMLLDFIKGPEEKVAVWRPPANKTSKDLHKMPLAIRAAFIEDMVASRFCKWLRGLGGTPPNIDEKSLKELFQIGIVNPTSASIRTVFEERTFIPDLVAEKLNLPEKTLLNQLHRHLQWDIAAEAQPEKIMAFGKYLEPVDQFRPPKNRTQETWLSCDSISKDMEQFSERAYKSIMDSR